MPGQPGPPGHPGPPVSAAGHEGHMSPVPWCSGDLEDSTAPATTSRCPALISQGEQGPDGPVGKEVRVRALQLHCPVGPRARSWHPLAWPWCHQGAHVGDIPATPLLRVSPGTPRKTWHGGTGWPEGEGRAWPCRRGRPGTLQPCGGLGLSLASPCLCRAKLDPPARGATLGRRAEPACLGGRGKVAPWASWGHGGRRERGVPPAPLALRAALGCRAPPG